MLCHNVLGFGVAFMLLGADRGRHRACRQSSWTPMPFRGGVRSQTDAHPITKANLSPIALNERAATHRVYSGILCKAVHVKTTVS